MLQKILLNEKNMKRNIVFWNAFSAMMNSFQTMVILMIVTRMGDKTDSSIFVMAYAVGNLMIHIGKYGVRQYQVTDVEEKYSFLAYLRARYVSMAFMFAGIAGYLGINAWVNDYSFDKTIVILMICVLKAIEAFEDVYHGRMQQKGRLDVAGRILGIRLCSFILMYVILYVATKNLVMTTFISLVFTAVMAIVLNGSVAGKFVGKQNEKQSSGVKNILLECLPLCICMCLNMYIANAPKYTIDSVVNDEVQTAFNIVFMPVFIIALLANFIFQPILKNLGELWAENKRNKLVSTTIKLTGIVIAVDMVITFVGSFIGNPVLGAIYGVDLKKYDMELIIFMLSGGIIALQNLYIMVITTVRYQKYMIYGYIFTALIMFLLGRTVLVRGGLVLLCWFFFGMICLLTLYCVGLIVIAVKKR